MTERTEQVSTYVTAETKEQLKNEARREDVPLSEYVRTLLERARLEDTQEQLARDLNAEERLLALLAEGKDEMVEIAAQVERQNEQIVAALDDLELEPQDEPQDEPEAESELESEPPTGDAGSAETETEEQVDEETRSFVEGLL